MERARTRGEFRPLPEELDPSLARALREARLHLPLLASGRGLRGSPRRRSGRCGDHDLDRLRQVACLQPAGTRLDRPRRQVPRALPVSDQGTGPGPGPLAQRALTAQPAPRDLRRRYAEGRTPGSPEKKQPGPEQSRHAPHRNPAPPPQLGGLLRQPRVGGDRRSPYLPRCLRLERGQRDPPAAEDRRRLRQPTTIHPRHRDDRQPR